MNDPLENVMSELCSKVEHNPASEAMSVGDIPRAPHATSFPAEVASPRPIFNPFAGKHYIRKHEKLEDRLVIMMKASGYTNIEIAEQLGITPVAVSYITKQPWAAEQVLEEIEHSGRDKVVAVLQGAAFDAAQRLIEISESAENVEVKRKANNDVLDRVLGRPNQPVEHHTYTHLEEMTDEELAKLVSKGRSN